ncbi:MAG TPA: hypothetical protein VEY07_05480, partial [Thermoplasmata archaeon]|nr:hypothetical protein [Thermoplasmata archaeon]
PEWLLYGHLFLGFGVVALAYSNSSSLRDTRVPGRLKRIAAATFSLSILMVVLGFLIWFHVGDAWATPVPGYSVYTVLIVFHAINAFAILAQAAAVAIAYDMWEDHEFEQVTEPGEVPPAPSSAPTSRAVG